MGRRWRRWREPDEEPAGAARVLDAANQFFQRHPFVSVFTGEIVVEANGPTAAVLRAAGHVRNRAAVARRITIRHAGHAAGPVAKLQNRPRITAFILQVDRGRNFARGTKRMNLVVHFAGVGAARLLRAPVAQPAQLIQPLPAGRHFDAGHDTHALSIDGTADVLDLLRSRQIAGERFASMLAAIDEARLWCLSWRGGHEKERGSDEEDDLTHGRKAPMGTIHMYTN